MNEVSAEFTQLAALIGANTVSSKEESKDNFKLNLFPNQNAPKMGDNDNNYDD